MPEVESLAQASRVPLSPGRSQATVRIGDEPEGSVVDVNTVTADFFALLDIPIVRGRPFVDDDVDSVLVHESTARRYWPGQDPIGRTVFMGGRQRHVVGVVRDARVSQAQDAISSYIYLPATRGAQRGISVLARTRDFSAFAAALRAETARMDAGLLVNVQPLSNNVALLQTLSQIAAGVGGILSLLAAVLAAVGVYGVVACVVSRRRREVGVRMALGAAAHDVQRLILRQTLRPIVVGLFIGVAAAAGTARLLEAVLFGVSPYDPVAFVAAPSLMLAIAAAAAFVPIRRAMRGNPMSVLRAE